MVITARNSRLEYKSRTRFFIRRTEHPCRAGFVLYHVGQAVYSVTVK